MFTNFRIKNILSLSILAIAPSLVSCSLRSNSNIAQAQAQAPEKLKIVASHNIICDLLTTLAEDTVDLTCLIDANQDPHTYRPTPSQRKAMEEAQLILYGGYQLEPKLIKLLEATETDIPKIALYEEAVAKPILAEHKHEEHSEEEHQVENLSTEHLAEEQEAEKPDKSTKEELEPDPHVWHNIENTVAMVELIQAILLQINPLAVESYLKNSVAFTEQLWQLDAWIDDQIATIPEGQRVLVTTHDSLNYYTQAYHLKDYKTLQGLNSEASPTASQVRELAAEIRQTEVPTIFAESTANDRVMNNVARAANVKLSEKKLFVDGLGETNNYTEMMVSNTCTIVNGLGGECTPFQASK